MEKFVKKWTDIALIVILDTLVCCFSACSVDDYPEVPRPVLCPQVFCSITPCFAVTNQDSSVQLNARMHSTREDIGDLSPVDFTWSVDSTSSDVVSVDSNGLVTSGSTNGHSFVSATATFAQGEEITCSAIVSNYKNEDLEKVRVVVIDDRSGVPVADVRVSSSGSEKTTDQNGLAIIDYNAFPLDLTFSHPDYTDLTLCSVEKNDVLVYMAKVADPTVSGGYKGNISMAKVPDPELSSDSNDSIVQIGISGTSVPGNLFHLNLGTLIGEIVERSIPDLNLTLPLPGSIQVGLGEPVGWLWQPFVTLGDKGTRVVWAMGAKLAISELIAQLTEPIIEVVKNIIDDIIDDIIEDPDHNLPGIEELLGLLLAEVLSPEFLDDIVVAVLPIFENFYVGVGPYIDIKEIPKNNEGVSDIEHFPNLRNKAVVDLPMDQSMNISVSDIPNMVNDDQEPKYPYDTVIVVSGVLVQDAGFIPLGISGGIDRAGHTIADGKISPITLKFSDVTGKLQEDQIDRVIIALAFSLSSLLENMSVVDIAGQVHFMKEETFPFHLDLDPFMLSAEGSFDNKKCEVKIDSVAPSADLLQMTVSGKNITNWQILTPPEANTYTLPRPNCEAWNKGTTLVAIELIEGLDYQTLLSFNAQNIYDLFYLTKGFVMRMKLGSE